MFRRFAFLTFACARVELMYINFICSIHFCKFYPGVYPRTLLSTFAHPILVHASVMLAFTHVHACDPIGLPALLTLNWLKLRHI